MSLWAKKWILQQHLQKQLEKTADTARHDPAPTQKTSQKYWSIFRAVSVVLATCPLHIRSCTCSLLSTGFSSRDVEVFLKYRLFHFLKITEGETEIREETEAWSFVQSYSKVPPLPTYPDMMQLQRIWFKVVGAGTDPSVPRNLKLQVQLH